MAIGLVGFAFSACARETDTPLQAMQPGQRPDVSAPSSPPSERSDVLIVQIGEQRDEPVKPLKTAPQEAAVETPGAAPIYRTAAGPGRSAPVALPSPTLQVRDAHPVAPTEDRRRRYTVREGDWIVQISRDQYGSASHAAAILDANRDQIPDPDHLVPGQELVLP